MGRKLDLSTCIYGPAGKEHGGFIAEPMAYYQLLAGLCAHARAIRVLEVGTHFGGATMSMLTGMKARSGAKPVRIATIDVTSLNEAMIGQHPEITRIIGSGSSPDVMDQAVRALGSPAVDILYIDALKSHEFVVNFLRAATRRVMPRWIIIDDININPSMRRMWTAVKKEYGPRAIDVSVSYPEVRSPHVGMGILFVHSHDLPIRLEENFSSLNAGVERYKSLMNAPWLRAGAPVSAVAGVPSTLRPREIKLLRYLAKTYYRGHGEIIDTGAALGAGALAMAQGLADNHEVNTRYCRIHSYGPFTVSMNEDQLSNAEHEAESSKLSQFMMNIREVKDAINVYVGDFCLTRWNGGSIEIFVDGISRTVETNAHVFCEFSRYWTPGETILVEHGFMRGWCCSMHYVLGFLEEHLDVIGVESPALVLGLRSSIPQWRLDRIEADDFRTSEKVDLILGLSTRIADMEAQGTLHTLAAITAARGGHNDRAINIFNRVLSDFTNLGDRWYWKRLREAHRFLQGSIGDIVPTLPAPPEFETPVTKMAHPSTRPAGS